jgi:hypothetical protein
MEHQLNRMYMRTTQFTLSNFVILVKLIIHNIIMTYVLLTLPILNANDKNQLYFPCQICYFRVTWFQSGE